MAGVLPALSNGGTGVKDWRKNMNQLQGTWRHYAVGAFAIAAACFLTGCGGGDGGSDSGSNNNNNNTVAPSTLAGKAYDLNGSGGTTVVTFASPTRYTWQAPGAAFEDGNWVGNQDGNAWTVGLTTDEGGTKTLRMSFNSGNSGSFVISRSGAADESGTFSARSTGGDPSNNTGDNSSATDGTTTDNTDGSNNTTTDGNGDGTTTNADGNTDGSTDGIVGSTDSGTTTGGPSTEYTGDAPVSLHARTLYGTRTFTSTGPTGQTHTYTFSGNMFHDSDPPEESDGTFTYNANNSHATLVFNYTTPAEFVGDRHELDMQYTARDRGTFTSTYTRGDGTVIVINGTFELDPLP
jgi:hypothetical protein